VPVNILTYEQFAAIGAHQNAATAAQLAANLRNATSTDIPAIYQAMASSYITLKDALSLLPAYIHVELHILFPSRLEEEHLKLGPTHDMNEFADRILTIVFEHARVLREQGAGEIDGTLRSVLFSSFNQDICTVLNWKQPNCKSPWFPRLKNTDKSTDPVLLCNELGADTTRSPSGSTHVVRSSGRTTISVKEAVQIARDNNFMGLICSSRLLVSCSNETVCPCYADIYNRLLRPHSLSPSRRPALSSSPILQIRLRMAAGLLDQLSQCLVGRQHLTAWMDT
jgi:CDK inhibitor PHO81